MGWGGRDFGRMFDRLLDLLEFTSFQQARRGIFRAYIGLHDLREEGVYEWFGRQGPTNYTNWAPSSYQILHFDSLKYEVIFV